MVANLAVAFLFTGSGLRLRARGEDAQRFSFAFHR